MNAIKIPLKDGDEILEINNTSVLGEIFFLIMCTLMSKIYLNVKYKRILISRILISRFTSAFCTNFLKVTGFYVKK